MHEQARCPDEAASHQLPTAVAFWIIWIVSLEEYSSLTQNVMRFIALLTHFECDGHTAHMLTQQHLPAPLTSTVKLSLFTHVHSGPLSLPPGLHQCHANHSYYINNGWTFSCRPCMYVNVSVLIKWTVGYKNTEVYRKEKGLQLKYGAPHLLCLQKDNRTTKSPCPGHCSPLSQYQNVAPFKLSVELVLSKSDLKNVGLLIKHTTHVPCFISAGEV